MTEPELEPTIGQLVQHNEQLQRDVAVMNLLGEIDGWEDMTIGEFKAAVHASVDEMLDLVNDLRGGHD